MKKVRVQIRASRRPSRQPQRVDTDTQSENRLSNVINPTSRGESHATRPKPSLNAAIRVRSSFSLLITDDDVSFRETLRDIFEPEGFRTLLAHTGEEALDILRQDQIHLALLDQHLPRMTGLETLRIIRQVNTLLPVILMTADSTQQLLRDALSAHAFCVMSKPVTRSVVVYTVRQALSRSYDIMGRMVGSGEPESSF